MRKKIIIAACALSMIAVSCTNDNETTPTPDPTGTKFLTTISDSTMATNVYSAIAYHPDMSFKSYTDYPEGSKTGKALVTTLQYTNSKPVAILTGVRTDGTDATVLYELQSNAAGQVVKVIPKKELQSNMKCDSLFYDTKGYITAIHHYGENGIDNTAWLTGIEKFTWENKNLVKVEEEFWQLGVKSAQYYVTTYTYDDKINPHKTVPQIACLYSQMETGPYLNGKLPYYAYASQNNPLVIASVFYAFEPGTGITGTTTKQASTYTYTEDGYPVTCHYELAHMEGATPQIIKQKYFYSIK